MHNPSGGLARRKTAFERERATGVPVVALDAGNALFRGPKRDDMPLSRPRAELLLEQMDALGTVAMAVGVRDLALGSAFLKKAMRGRKMKLLSANLVDASGKAPFAASTVVEAGGLRLGVVGVSPEGAVPGEPRLVGRPPIAAALAEARRLRKAEKLDVVVVLAAVPYSEALQIGEQAGEAVDFVVQSHDNRGMGLAQRAGSHASIFPAGERGRQLARLELTVEGPGPSVDLSETRRAREQLGIIEGNLQRARERLPMAQRDTDRHALEQTITSFEARRKELQAQAQLAMPAGGRGHRLSYLTLGSDVPDDAALKQRVERLEPRPAPH